MLKYFVRGDFIYRSLGILFKRSFVHVYFRGSSPFIYTYTSMRWKGAISGWDIWSKKSDSTSAHSSREMHRP